MSKSGGADQFERLASTWLRRSDVTRGQMFGWAGLKTGRRFFALSIGGHLIVKLPEGEVAALVEEATATLFDPGWGRVKKSWADVSPVQLSTWEGLLDRAYRHVVSLGEST